MIRLFALALIGALACAPARGDELRDQAKVHYDLGRSEFQAARYDRAMVEFRASYATAPIPDLLYNIGRCQEELGDRAGAAKSYRQYLAAKPTAEERGELEGHIGELERSPAAAPVHPAPSAAPLLASRPAPRPVWRRGWFWAVVVGVAVVVAGAATLAALLASPASYDYGFPPITLQGMK